MRSPLEPGDLAALVALASLPGIGPGSMRRWLESGTAQRAWQAVVDRRPSADPVLAIGIARKQAHEDQLAAAAARTDPVDLLERHLAGGVEVLVHGFAGYPARLADDPSPPPLLFVDGDLSALEAPTVAIIGTRNATRLGCDTAGALAIELARAGACIVSGLALGIDGAAHAALVRAIERTGGCPDQAGSETSTDESEDLSGALGRPVAVVAAGLDRRYPRAHAGLHDRIVHAGAVVSEVPFGVAPSRWRFPARNRIIAGLADVVVVVESRSAGGSMLTVADALLRDRPVLAVPGHPSTPTAAGTLDLICDGAIPVRDARDVLIALGFAGADLASEGGRTADGTGAAASRHDEVTSARWRREVLAALVSGPRTLGDLVRLLDAPMDELAELLLRLELAGDVSRTGVWYEARLGGDRPAGGGSR